MSEGASIEVSTSQVEVASTKSEVAPPLFGVDKLSRNWGQTTALHEVSLEIQPQEIVLLAGPSGSGKTTLLRMLAGALRPSSGSVLVNGLDIGAMSSKQLKEHRTHIGIVEQGSMLVPQLNVHRNVLAGLIGNWPWYKVLRSALMPVEVARVGDLLEQMDLKDRQWDTTGILSGGQQQRVAVARALVCDPTVILADEPTASLDPNNATAVTQLIVEAARARQGTALLCSHWVSLALPFVDRVVGLRAGEIVLDARAEDVSDKILDELYEGSRERA
jgi:phosphonate transport system ATP-binding protein